MLHRSCSWLNRKSSALRSAGFVRRLESRSRIVRLGQQSYSLWVLEVLAESKKCSASDRLAVWYRGFEPDFSKAFSRHGASRHLSRKFLSSVQSYPGQHFSFKMYWGGWEWIFFLQLQIWNLKFKTVWQQLPQPNVESFVVAPERKPHFCWLYVLQLLFSFLYSSYIELIPHRSFQILLTNASEQFTIEQLLHNRTSYRKSPLQFTQGKLRKLMAPSYTSLPDQTSNMKSLLFDWAVWFCSAHSFTWKWVGKS